MFEESVCKCYGLLLRGNIIFLNKMKRIRRKRNLTRACIINNHAINENINVEM